MSVYLAHYAAVREDKDTTKVRVVFDASNKGDNNLSLNDVSRWTEIITRFDTHSNEIEKPQDMCCCRDI